MDWLVYQQLIEEEDFDTFSGRYNIKAPIVIRKVAANTEEEAIGKFIKDTEGLTFKRRCEPITCFELDRLKTI